MGRKHSQASRTPESLQTRIESAIRESGVSVRKLAAVTGIPPSTLHRSIISGEWWIADFLVMCAALRLDPVTLLDSTTEPAAVVEAGRIAELVARLTVAERYAVRSIVETALELRDTAVQVDRERAATSRKT